MNSRKITRRTFSEKYRDYIVKNYKSDRSSTKTRRFLSHGNILTFRNEGRKNVKKAEIYKPKIKVKNDTAGDIIGHRDDGKIKSGHEVKKNKSCTIRRLNNDTTSGDFIGHRDIKKFLSRRRPRSAKKVRPKFRMFQNGDIIAHSDKLSTNRKLIFGRRPASAQTSRRFLLNSGDIIAHSDKHKFKISSKIGRRMVDVNRHQFKSGGKRMGFNNMKSKLRGPVPRNGFEKFKRSPSPKREYLKLWDQRRT